MTFAVPVVDISSYVHDGTAEERAATARAMDAFFGLPLEAKNAWRTPPEVNRGYSPPKSESLSLSLGVEAASRMNDFFEAFNVGASQETYPHAPGLPQPDYAENTWPDVAGFEPAVEAWSTEAARVARTLTRVFADSLGLEPDFFARLTGHSLDVLRMNNYALPEGTVRLDEIGRAHV